MSELPLLAALFSVPASVGYPLLFAFVAAESAGAFVPGETSLIVAGALAASGRLSLPLVIVVAATAAILGDNVGYVIGRRGLRPLVDRPGRWTAGRRRLFERGEVFFARRGSAAREGESVMTSPTLTAFVCARWGASVPWGGRQH